MKTCPLCGKINKDDAKFCVYCGTDISNEVDESKIIEAESSMKEEEPLVPTSFGTNEDKIDTPNGPKADPNGWQSEDTMAILGMAFGGCALPLPGLIFAIRGLKSKRLHGLAVAGVVVNSIFAGLYVIGFILRVSLRISFLGF